MSLLPYTQTSLKELNQIQTKWMSILNPVLTANITGIPEDAIVLGINQTSGALDFVKNSSTAGQVLTSNGMTKPPSWQSINLGTTTSYTPAIVGNGTVSNLSAFYRVSGDNLSVKATWTTGTCTGVQWQFPLPAGYKIDYTKISSSTSILQSVGMLWQYFTTASFAGTAGGPYPILVDGTDTGFVVTSNHCTSSFPVISNGNGTFNNSGNYSIEFNVPVKT